MSMSIGMARESEKAAGVIITITVLNTQSDIKRKRGIWKIYI